MPAYSPLINGKTWDWANIDCVIFGSPLPGITEIEYSVSQDKVLNYGAGSEPVSWGVKNKVYKGSFTVYYDEVKAFLATAPNRSILEIPPFPVTILMSGLGVAVSTDKLLNVMFTEDPFSVKQNDSLILVKIPFIFAGILK